MADLAAPTGEPKLIDTVILHLNTRNKILGTIVLLILLISSQYCDDKCVNGTNDYKRVANT